MTDFTLGKLIERNERDRGGIEMFVDGQRRITYGAYADRVRRLADGLHRLGIRRQDRVAFLGRNGISMLEIFGACEWAGFIPAPVNFRLAPAELVGMISDSSPSILLYQKRYEEKLSQIRSQLPAALLYACIDDHDASDPSMESVIASGSVDGPPFRARPDDFAHLFYTSGTTGKPKGVAHRHEVMEHLLISTALMSEFTNDTILLQTAPYFHTGGKHYVTTANYVGGKVVFQDGFVPPDVLDAIETEKVTFTFMVAAMIQSVLEVPGVDQRDLSSIRKIVSAAAPIPVPLLKRAIDILGPVFAVQYGCTETANIGNLWKSELWKADGSIDAGRLASVGRPVPGIDLRVVDEDGTDCPVGVPGEVLVRGKIMPHYWNNDIATKDAIRDGWYHTGDVGQRDAEGFLYLVDRKKDMIVSAGENIYSREVENAISLHPMVKEVAVIGIPHPRWVEAVCAVIVPNEGAALDAASIDEHCRPLIAGYKCPKSIEIVDELPRLSTGKIDKLELRRTYGSKS